jgi:hypothetical protein
MVHIKLSNPFVSSLELSPRARAAYHLDIFTHNPSSYTRQNQHPLSLIHSLQT